MQSTEEIAAPETEDQEHNGADDNIRYFRDVLIRLTFAAHGWDDRLDGVLERLQDELRTHHDLPDLKNYSETLYRALMRAEEKRPARKPGQILAKALAGLELPPAFHDEWQALMDRSRTARDEIQALEVLEECATLLGKALQDTSPRKTARKPGLLASLFGDQREQQPPGDFMKAVQHRLLELLSSLCPPPGMEERMEQLKDQASELSDPETIPHILGQIILLIQDIRGRVERERLELEKFLGQITERLTTIEGALEETDASTREVFTNREKFDAEIEEQTRDMEDGARCATDLSTLQKLVQQRVDTIRTRMDEYQEQEQELVRKAEERMSELAGRLQDMEQETELLRKQVQEERRQAFTDALTGLPNRFAYEERLEQEYDRWQRYGSPLSVLIVDVDHFKRINDTYGHQAGDKALRIIARELSLAIRKTDFIGRYGGEEIVILMPETPAEAALVAANKLRQRIEECGFHFRDRKVTITVSCGLSEYREGDATEDAFERADQALYDAKKQGRNRCVAG